jgi:hypothetical protein
MSRAAQAFKQTDVSKAIRGARNAQLAFDRVEIDKAGKITIHVAAASSQRLADTAGDEAA